MAEKFSNLIKSSLLNASAEAEPGVVDIQLATAILMFEVVRVDGHIDRAEMTEVIDSLRERFSLEGEEIGRLLEMASDKVNPSLDLDSFALKLRENWSQDQRLRLLRDFWVIAVADRVIDDRERQLIERIAGLLDLNEEETDRARRQAKHWLEFKTT